MGVKDKRKTIRRARERKREHYGSKSSPICNMFGHDWRRDVYKTAATPAGYVVEKCVQCEKTRATYMGY